MKGLKTNLFGLPAIMDLNLVALIGETNTTHADTYMISFHHYFKELGILESLTIFSSKLMQNHVHCLLLVSSLCRYVQRFFKKIKRMEEIGIISKVDLPTQWCTGMVVVPKKNGSVRIPWI